MKTTFRILALAVLGLLLCRYFAFHRPVDEVARTMQVVPQDDFQRQLPKWVGQQVRMQGVVTASLYLPGIGWYRLTDSRGYSIYVICDHYPPPDQQLIDVVLYVQPLFKLDAPFTVQFEVEIMEVILSQVNR